MPVPNRNKSAKQKAKAEDESLKNEEALNDELKQTENDEQAKGDKSEQPEVMPEKPAYVPLLEREILPEILYVKRTHKNGATLNGILINLHAGMVINDRFMAWTLLKQGVELVESLAECQ